MEQKKESRWQEVMKQFNEPDQWEKKTPEEQARERLKFEITEELGGLMNAKKRNGE